MSLPEKSRKIKHLDHVFKWKLNDIKLFSYICYVQNVYEKEDYITNVTPKNITEFIDVAMLCFGWDFGSKNNKNFKMQVKHKEKIVAKL